MTNERAITMVRQLFYDRGPFHYGKEARRLIVNVVRELAKGRAVSVKRASEIGAGAGIREREAGELLAQIAERGTDGDVVGILPGLSLNEHPHGFRVNGVQMSAWCAQDTLILPAVLGQSASIESRSPLSGETVQLRVSPEKVEEVSPDGAVVSWVIVEPDKADAKSAQAILSTFCRHIHFFASREEAEQWAAGRENIEILSMNEAYEMGKLIAGRLLGE